MPISWNSLVTWKFANYKLWEYWFVIGWYLVCNWSHKKWCGVWKLQHNHVGIRNRSFYKGKLNIFATKIVLTIARKTLPSSKTYLFKTVHFFMKFYFYESLMTPCNCGLPYRGQRIYEVAFDYQNPAHVVRNAEGWMTSKIWREKLSTNIGPKSKECLSALWEQESRTL